MKLGIATASPASSEDVSPANETLILGSVDCAALKVSIDTVRLEHGDQTQRLNAEGALTDPTDAEGYRKWPANWVEWWNANSIALTIILFQVPVASVTVVGAPDDELMVDFGDQDVSSTSASVSIEIKNKGIADLKVKAVVETGVNSSDFDAVTIQVPEFVVPPGLTELITVDFTPGAQGTRLASLDIETNDPHRPLACVGLCGNGIAT